MKTVRILCCAAALVLSAANAAAQILIGQSADMSGPVAASVKETIVGSQLVIDHVNAQGGINGEKIEVIRLDDGLDPKRSAENSRILIEDKKVIALLLNRGTPNALAVIPLLDKSGTPMIGPSTGAMALHKPVQKFVFNVRSTYQREAEKAIQHLNTVGMQRIAVVQAEDSFGKDAMEGAMKGFDKAGLKPVAVALADRNKPDFAAIVPKLTAANAQAVLWIGSGTSVSEGIKALRASGSAAQVITLSNNAASGFIKDLGTASGGVIVTQVLPSERAMAHPLIKEASDLAKAKGDIELSPALLEGFVATKVLVEALRRTGPKPTRAKLLATLNDFRYDAGGGLEVGYSPQDHTGIDYVDLSIISGGRFKR
ncbi:ABC transporter substrate-binding protein [Variovorax soli]|uniref:ABC-type branched-subunit amino acid transport system substrate-binding protein n=1 Tax=Variovorax soli TaxID=376815 RepID=A0ABU1N7D2_9BURK|nr:ABC transporter substrate-binding protein [Variovorax soli]MDR6534334.1 ABC-type branched-subunit amino acid transport system substrate-binding protein [Variovorax soli]